MIRVRTALRVRTEADPRGRHYVENSIDGTVVAGPWFDAGKAQAWIDALTPDEVGDRRSERSTQDPPKTSSRNFLTPLRAVVL